MWPSTVTWKEPFCPSHLLIPSPEQHFFILALASAKVKQTWKLDLAENKPGRKKNAKNCAFSAKVILQLFHCVGLNQTHSASFRDEVLSSGSSPGDRKR